jgi:hypothetical protein
VTYDGIIYTSAQWDWRELIYQMAIDYFKHNQEDGFEITVAQNNYDEKTGMDYYPNGITGYE